MKITHIATLLISLLVITNQTAAQIPETGKGLVERLENFPSYHVTSRHIDIWTPEGYDKRKKYPVIYMHDGQMLFDSTHTWNHKEWKVDEMISDLIDKDLIPPCIIVGIHNSRTRHADYFPQKVLEILPPDIIESYMPSDRLERLKSQFPNGPQSDNYLKFIVEDLKPYIDQSFSTKTGRAFTFLMGSSMGGLISMYGVCEYPEVFGGAACLSTHWIGGATFDDTPVPAAFQHYIKTNMPFTGGHRFYYDHGTLGLDALYGKHQQAVDILMRKSGYSDKNYQSEVHNGHDHNEDYWAERVDDAVTFMLESK